MQDFVYERPETIAEAVAALRGGDARALAGGTDLIPQLREGRRRAERVVDLKRIPELTAIAALPDGGVSIGAAANATAVSRHRRRGLRVSGRRPVGAADRRRAGAEPRQPRRQHLQRGAVGGRGAGADLHAAREPSSREPTDGASCRSRQLFKGPGKTILDPGELLVSILLPPAAPRSAAKYLRFTPRREMDIAIAGAGAWLRLDADGTIAEARIVLASVGPTPIRAPSAERKLVGERPTGALFEEAGRLAAGDARPISDTRGSADYRRSLVAVLTARALADCCRQLGIEVATA